MILFVVGENMDLNRYNTRVRQAMSDAYVDCGKRRQKVRKELDEVKEKVGNGQETISYAEYNRLVAKAVELQREYDKLKIEREVWDMAREICMEIADEMCEKVK